MKQMQYYAAVCRTLNITKAAEDLYISQPALSLAVKEIEKEAGTSLFSRAGNRLQMTESGRILYREVLSVLRQAEHVERMIRTGSLTQKYIRFGFSSVVGIMTAPGICHAYSTIHPEISLQVSEDIGANLLHQLEEGLLDIVLTGSAYSTMPEWKEKFDTCDISYSPLVYCVGKTHPLASRRTVTPEEIAAYPIAMLGETYPIFRHIETVFEERGCRLNIVLRSNQMYTIEQFVANGYTAGFLPLTSPLNNTCILSLYCMEMDGILNPETMTKLYWRKDNSNTPLIRGFLDAAEEAYPHKQK